MKTIFLEEKYILEYIKDILHDLKEKQYNVNFAKYHHNSSYRDAVSICKNGILTMQDLRKYGIKNYTDDFLKIYDDVDSHVNGTNAVSLSVTGLNDLYKDEFEYDPFNPNQVDFLVSSDLRVCRSSNHYGNEFLSFESIATDKLKSVDIRLLKLISEMEKKYNTCNLPIEKIIENYNFLREIALVIKNNNQNLPLREVSYDDQRILDINKVLNVPALSLKK